MRSHHFPININYPFRCSEEPFEYIHHMHPIVDLFLLSLYLTDIKLEYNFWEKFTIPPPQNWNIWGVNGKQSTTAKQLTKTVEKREKKEKTTQKKRISFGSVRGGCFWRVPKKFSEFSLQETANASNSGRRQS